MIKAGLKKEARDSRTFQLGALTTLPPLSDLPQEFKLEPFAILNQLDTDFCSSFATCGISMLQEEILLDPLWGFAVSKMISGDIDEFGQSILNALKVHIKYGALPEQNAPFVLEKDNEKIVRDIKNYPDLYDKARPQEKRSFIEITGSYDAYDNIRAFIWKFRNEKRGAVMGLNWHWPLNQNVLNGASDKGEGHLIAIIGWTKEGLVLLNSAGIEAGEQGLHILPRVEANYYLKEYNGAYSFIDFSPEELRLMLAKNLQIEQSYLLLLQKLLIFLKSYVQYLRPLVGFISEIVGSLFSRAEDRTN